MAKTNSQNKATNAKARLDQHEQALDLIINAVTVRGTLNEQDHDALRKAASDLTARVDAIEASLLIANTTPKVMTVELDAIEARRIKNRVNRFILKVRRLVERVVAGGAR